MTMNPQKEIIPSSYEEKSAIAFPYNSHLYTPNCLCFFPHWHDWMEILFVFYGSLTVHVNEEAFTVGEGEIALFYPGQLHVAAANNEGARYSIAMFDPSAFSSGNRSAKKYLSSIFEGRDTYANRSNHPEVLQSVTDFLSCFDGAGVLISHPLVLVSTVYKMLAAIQAKCLVNERKRKPVNRDILAVLQHINNHINDTLSTEMLSDFLGYETSYFIRLFKKNVGMTPRNYIRSIRLEKAEKELITTDVPINVIARNCGFENMSYFTRAFQEVYHTTPSAYRKKQTNAAPPHESQIFL